MHIIFFPRSCIDTHLNVNLSLMLNIALPELANRLEKQQADQNNSTLLSGAEIFTSKIIMVLL